MQLEFISVEEFYFALTLAVRTLEEIDKPGLVEQVRSRLLAECGQPSTVAPGKQNTFNYVFKVKDTDNIPAPSLIVSISDWQDKLRLSSDYGWVLDQQRKPIRTDKYDQRSHFNQNLRSHLQKWLHIPFD
ncbi:MAG: hypothetical protein KME28_16895 [Pelatocladus maniniholoensis HA4357-MV3]|jgi:hypothetical protein|uniref:Uncharacterized protein n=1 Tax=Pelatocladus maniniholoensis HA4357-MV3 TaxID=1117104 RepID=A0A9E3LU75_9NOST|nr:hypothetical protein [Pelatocladus maniniholoensis HA4357-MV3]BAZ68654.1 hypothetical protein NIES4106_34190 [Fischerella sp. NIES-4106]